MKILIISSYFDRPGALIGGSEAHSEILSRLLADHGHETFLGCWQEGTISLTHARGTLPTRRIRMSNALDIRAIASLIRVVKLDRIGVIIANSPKEYWPAVIAAKLTGTKVVLIRHLTRKISPVTRIMINAAADCVIAVSNSVCRALVRSGIRKDIIRVVINGVPDDEISASMAERDKTRAELGFAPEDVVIGFAGRLSPEKGLACLINAFSRITDLNPKTRLLIVGDGPERQAMQQQAQGMGLSERVVFTGRIVPVYRMYAAMDIFAMPSICEEAFGFAAAEAMAMGKPVIASASGGLAELITDTVDGLLVPPGDEEALTAAISRLISDPEQARALGVSARGKIHSYFSDRIQGTLMHDLVLDITGRSVIKVSLIITTYNSPDFLRKVLDSILIQSRMPHEVIIADDGSGDETAAVVRSFAGTAPFAVRHVWQQNKGFRAARIRNKSIMESSGDYIVLLDGDCVVNRHFIEDHCRLARHGCFIQGKRVLVGRDATGSFDRDTANSTGRLLKKGLSRGISQIHHLIRFPHDLSITNRNLRGTKSCNMSFFRKDILAVNGFNEDYIGWGQEDSDLACRFFNLGLAKKVHPFMAICFHLWHPSNKGFNGNMHRLRAAMSSETFFCSNGIRKGPSADSPEEQNPERCVSNE